MFWALRNVVSITKYVECSLKKIKTVGATETERERLHMTRLGQIFDQTDAEGWRAK